MKTARKGFATELIHAGETDIGVAGAAHDAHLRDDDVRVRQRAGGRRVQRGALGEVPLLALHEPDGGQRRAEARGARPRGGGAAVLVGAGRDDDDPDGAAAGGRRGRLQRRDLRRHAAPARTTCSSSFGVPAAVRVARRAGRARARCSATGRGWSGSSRRSTRRCAASTSRAIAAACRARGVLSVIDNTFASPINQQPLALGVDLAMQSATKYLNGHSDVTGGRGRRPAALVEPIEKARRMLGTVLDPAPGLRARPRAEDAAAARRAPQRERAGGRRVPRRRPRASAAGLLSGPARRIPTTRSRRAQMSGFGGMVSFDLGGELRARGAALYDRLQIDQARGEPRRRREPGEPAGAHVAVGAHRRAAARGRRDARDDAAVGRAGGSGGPDRRPRPGART